MAGDWIKMRRGLRHDPKVIAITRELVGRRDFINWWSDPVHITCHSHVTECVTFANVTRVTVCALLDVWASLNITLGKDGKAPYMCLQDIDDIAEIPGFGEAMESVGWVIDNGDEGLVFPNFSENNSPTKTRTTAPKTDAERAATYRANKKLKKGVTASRHVTTEKIREDISIKDTLSEYPKNCDDDETQTDDQNQNIDPKPEKPKTKGTRLPASWQPTVQDVEFCRKERPELEPSSLADQFRDYWLGIAGQKGVKIDWSATWRNWVRNQRHRPPTTTPKPSRHKGFSQINYNEGISEDGRF